MNRTNRATDLTGKRFGKLVVIERVERPASAKGTYAFWQCKCDCGGNKIVTSRNLKNGHTRSCGCLVRERLVTHGMSDTRIYARWNQMRERCKNPKDIGYANYGGRGIKVCKEWNEDFVEFYNWALSSGYAEGLEIDRINTNGNYCPENCRWISRIENTRNKRNTTRITINGITKPLVVWAEESGIDYKTIHARIYRGWSGERLLIQPSR